MLFRSGARDVTHIRRCILADDAVDVFDELHSKQGSVEVRVHWLIPDGVPVPTIESANGGTMTVFRASDTTAEGWRSLQYVERHPATSVTFVMMLSGRATIHSRFVATNLPRKP